MVRTIIVFGDQVKDECELYGTPHLLANKDMMKFNNGTGNMRKVKDLRDPWKKMKFSRQIVSLRI